MTGRVTDFRDDDVPTAAEAAFLERLAKRVQPKRARHVDGAFPLAGEVVDVQVLSPRQHQVARFVGRLIGIAAVYVIAGFIWGYRGVAWAASRALTLAHVGPKEMT
jgi:hypothetical protein